MSIFVLVCMSLTVCFTAGTIYNLYNLWKIGVCNKAFAWYLSGARGPKPKAVLTFERRWR